MKNYREWNRLLKSVYVTTAYDLYAVSDCVGSFELGLEQYQYESADFYQIAEQLVSEHFFNGFNEVRHDRRNSII